MDTSVNRVFVDCLSVGARASLTPRPQSKTCPRYGTILRGWEENRYLIYDLPELGEQAVPLGRDLECVIRMVTAGEVCAFQSTIIQSYPQGTAPHFYLKWPREFDTMTIRQHQRLDVDLPCSIVIEHRPPIEGRIRDLSSGGCRIETADELPLQAEALVSFTLPDGMAFETLSSVVRNVRKAGDGWTSGLQFVDEREALMREIEFFINTSLARLRGVEAGQPAVLILSDRSNLEELVRAIEGHNITAVATHDPVDAFYRMRLVRPNVMMVEHGGSTTHWTAVDLCRLAANAPCVTGLKIVLADLSVPPNIESAGVAACLPPNTNTEQIVEVIERLLDRHACSVDTA